MWYLQILETWEYKSTIQITTNSHELLGSKYRGIQSIWDSTQNRGERYICFIIGLSRQGEVVNIRACGASGENTIDEYIATYFLPDTEKVEVQVLIRVIKSLSVKVIILVLAEISVLTLFHQES